MPAEHVCLVYASEDSRRSLQQRWSVRGRHRNERVLRIGPESGNAGTPIEVDRIEATEAYLVGGILDVDRRFASHAEMVREALAVGRSGVRMSARATVARDVLGDDETLLAYEEALDRLCSQQPIAGLCEYDSAAFSPEMLARAASHHHRVVVADHDGVTVLDLRRVHDGAQIAGELDMATGPILTSWLRTAPRVDGRVRIDCQDITFVDVAGLRALADGGPCVVGARSTAMERLLPLLGGGFPGLAFDR